MGRKEELVYEVLGLPFPRAYFDELGAEQTGLRSLLIKTGRVPRSEQLLYDDQGVYVGDIQAQDIEEAIISVMDEYLALVQEALDIPDLSEDEKRKIKDRDFASYKNYIEAFSSDKNLINKHFPGYASDEARAHYISNFEPTIQGYISALKKSGLKISAFFLRKLALLIPEEDRERHTYICAKTGSGKSELLKILIYSYLRKSDYCTTVIIEPHGDLCEEVARFKENITTDSGIVQSKNLIYIDPVLDDDYTPSINPFQIRDKSENNIDAVSQALNSVFEELLKSVNLSLQMKVVLIPCICVLLRMENASIDDLQIFMDDEKNGHLVNLGRQSPNEKHRKFFINGFHNKSYITTKQSIYTKIQSLLNSPSFANFISKRSTFDLEEALNSKSLIIFNLSKGKMGDDSSEAAGRFIVAMIQSIIKKRIWEKKADRVPIHMYIDECQNYVSPSIETVLTELRKFGLHLTLANQFIGQNMDTQFKNALLSSTGIKIIGMNNANSLSVLSTETGANFDELQKLNVGEFYIKCRERKPRKLYVPRFLEGNKNSMTHSEWKDVLREQKTNYYQRKKPIQEQTLSEEIHAGKQSIKTHGTASKKPKLPL
jgi:hypothetical protein